MKTCIVIPVIDEAENVQRLVSELGDAVPKARIFFIDDSITLETVEAIKAAASDFPWLDIRYLHRVGEDRVGGIIGAVRMGLMLAKIEGFATAVVMDGDGQHNPSDIPAMINRLSWNDLVPSTRYARGGSREGLDGPLRFLGSFAATRLAKGLFPERLADVTDPMTGFFAANLSKIKVGTDEASGFKVLLEILLTHPGLTISEVPVRFRERYKGESKASTVVAREYLTQLIRLRLQKPAVPSMNERKLQLNNV